jgi:hypothetical protein
MIVQLLNVGIYLKSSCAVDESSQWNRIRKLSTNSYSYKIFELICQYMFTCAAVASTSTGTFRHITVVSNSSNGQGMPQSFKFMLKFILYLLQDLAQLAVPPEALLSGSLADLESASSMEVSTLHVTFVHFLSCVTGHESFFDNYATVDSSLMWGYWRIYRCVLRSLQTQQHKMSGIPHDPAGTILFQSIILKLYYKH